MKIIALITTAVLLVISLVACTQTNEADLNIRVITPQQAYEIMQGGTNGTDFLLLDVRTPEEYAQGHISGAFLVNINDFTWEDNHKIMPVLIYCRSGVRSTAAAKELANRGFTQIYDMGGIIAWQAAGFEIIITEDYGLHLFNNEVKTPVDYAFGRFNREGILNGA